MVRTVLAAAVSGLVLAASGCSRPGLADDSAPVAPPLEETAHQHAARMAWWREARFGMFIHWGVYSQAAGEWGGRPVGGVGEWIMHYAHIPPEQYRTLAPAFNPVKFDARAWVRAARNAGMKYIVITSKHHDGFCLWDSALTDWDIVDATPFRRDALKELAAARRDEGVRLCFYHSIMDWSHPLARKETWPAYREHLKGQLKELLTGYGPIGVLWFDGEWIDEWTEEQGRDLYAMVRTLQPAIIVNNRVGKGRDGMAGLSTSAHAAGDFGTPEQEIPATGQPGMDWESCMTMNDTWGFKRADTHWKSSTALVRMLIDCASKGGNFLLNVGPTGEGEIPQASLDRLDEVGRWMEVNAESIYGTGASPFKKLSWGRATTRMSEDGRRGVIYLHVFDWPADGRLLVPGFRTAVSHAALLGSRPSGVGMATVEGGLELRLPVGEPPSPHASVIRLDLDGPVVVDPPPALAADRDGRLIALAADADLVGTSIKLETIAGRQNIGFWTSPGAVAWWSVDLPAGRYRATLDFSCAASTAGGRCKIALGEQVVTWTVLSTASWDRFQSAVVPGEFDHPGGRVHLRVAPADPFKGALMNLRSVELERLADAR